MKCLVGDLTYQSCDHTDNTQHTLSLPRSNSEIDFIFGKEFKTICRCVSLGGHIVGAPGQDILGGSVAQQLWTTLAAASLHLHLPGCRSVECGHFVIMKTLLLGSALWFAIKCALHVNMLGNDVIPASRASIEEFEVMKTEESSKHLLSEPPFLRLGKRVSKVVDWLPIC